MTEWKLEIPVVLIIFNRPDQTKQVFEVIRYVKPPKLFVIADGPRIDRPGEMEKCAATRHIIEEIDWKCEVIKNYSSINLGCGKRVSTGITWVFEQVDEAIIIEDDCLPNLTFFRFCSQLLEKYRYDEKIMMIGGTNHLEKWKKNLQSYHFSYYGSIWGWASWKRAWSYYDYEMKLWNQPESKTKLLEVLVDKEQFQHQSKICQKVFDGEIDTWDYQWSFARLLQAGLTIVPSVNLVSNIGFGKGATHTTNPSILNANLDCYSLEFPIKAPKTIAVDREYDRKYFLKLIGKQDIDLVNSLAFKLLNKHRNIHALILLEKAIATHPDVPGLNYGKAVALARLGNTNKAIETLNYLLTLMPEHKKAKILLNELYQCRKHQT